MTCSSSGAVLFFISSSWYLLRKFKASHMRMVLLRLRPSLYCRRCSAQARTLWSPSNAAADRADSAWFYCPHENRNISRQGENAELTFALHLNNPLLVVLRAKVTVGPQLGVAMDGVHHFLYYITKGVLRSTSTRVTRCCQKATPLKKNHKEPSSRTETYLFSVLHWYYCFLWVPFQLPGGQCHDFGSIQVCTNLRQINRFS